MRPSHFDYRVPQVRIFGPGRSQQSLAEYFPSGAHNHHLGRKEPLTGSRAQRIPQALFRRTPTPLHHRNRRNEYKNSSQYKHNKQLNIFTY
jgi:hypothetical protein